MPLKRLANFDVGGIRLALEKRDGGHNHPAGAVAALESVFIYKRPLNGMHLPVARERFNGGDILSVHLGDRGRATEGGFAVDQNGARAASAFAAAVFAAGEVEIFAENFKKRPVGIGGERFANAIDREDGLNWDGHRGEHQRRIVTRCKY